MGSRTTLAQAEDCIRRREPFAVSATHYMRESTGVRFSFQGLLRPDARTVGDCGLLPLHCARELVEHMLEYPGAVRYLVLSYETPIAWELESGGAVCMPPYRYSPTTNSHQGIAARALGVGKWDSWDKLPVRIPGKAPGWQDRERG